MRRLEVRVSIKRRPSLLPGLGRLLRDELADALPALLWFAAACLVGLLVAGCGGSVTGHEPVDGEGGAAGGSAAGSDGQAGQDGQAGAAGQPTGGTTGAAGSTAGTGGTAGQAGSPAPACGGPNQPCCGGKTCQLGLGCEPVTNLCRAFGFLGAPCRQTGPSQCWDGSWCATWNYCDAEQSKCSATAHVGCGENGQPCCTGAGAFECSDHGTGLTCWKDGKCRPTGSGCATFTGAN